MKLGIVGIGAVGAATAMAIVLRGRVRELILVNRNRGRAKGVATDMRYGVPLSAAIAIADGEARRRLGEAARARAAERYDWEQVTSRYLELCERSLG